MSKTWKNRQKYRKTGKKTIKNIEKSSKMSKTLKNSQKWQKTSKKPSKISKNRQQC